MGVGVVDGVGDETVLTNRFVDCCCCLTKNDCLLPELKVVCPDVKARQCWLLNSNITERRARTVCILHVLNMLL